ncbi:helix-turn-helix domain-containing protein [Mesorhizobium sp. ISC25]|uniref:helix-turn-helix domain-containing protein n=1 Tax=Mesorhizobium sp. ISC25 TaxID=3077335 RepID=UPI0035DB8D40
MTNNRDVPEFFVYGEPSRSLDVGFLHVETVRERDSLHLGTVAAHKHPHMGQVTFWTSGPGNYQIEDSSWDFSAPAVSFVPSDVVHGFVIEPGADAIVVSIANDVLNGLQDRTTLSVRTPVFVAGSAHLSAWSQTRSVLDTLFNEYREGLLGSERILPELVAVVLSYIARLNAGRVGPSASPAVALAIELRQLVDETFKEAWSVDQYVSALGTTPHLLDKAVREVLGKSVKDIVLDRRLIEAKRLLKFTIRPVEDIAFAIGFKDPAYFSRFFRLHVGQSPTRWRANGMNKGDSAGAS